MGNRADLAAVMPAMLLHEGHWQGWYRDFSTDGALLDARRVKTWCEFPDDGPHHYIQHNWLTWETDRFAGHGWQTAEDVLMLRLDRRDVADAYYIEMIVTAADRRTRARTWQWFQGGLPWKWTLCNEERP